MNSSSVGGMLPTESDGSREIESAIETDKKPRPTKASRRGDHDATEKALMITAKRTVISSGDSATTDSMANPTAMRAVDTSG